MDNFYRLVAYLLTSFLTRQLLLGLHRFYESGTKQGFYVVSGWTVILLLVITAIVWPLCFLVLKHRARWWIAGLTSTVVALGLSMRNIIEYWSLGEAAKVFVATICIHWFIVGSLSFLVAELAVSMRERIVDNSVSKRTKAKTPSYW